MDCIKLSEGFEDVIFANCVQMIRYHIFAIGVEQGLELGRHHVDARLQFGQAVTDVVHLLQELSRKL